ncbi:tautomerase family protein [Ktedonosporobacter rubrisoli]|uniref:Tautomerase family protein n=1 Tax=Ktedonosporobacter rubrisoli TaxID=2509675 RepID=A0A4P6JMX9_KTERU|nr:tautomerase family protein [Ktedonosporobacter rubrisoli]QBD76615.1 tautomerase family protein [Ktedonosporobacter rubrisoli]
MPLVHINLRQGKSTSYIRSICEAVQQALVECLDVPVRDKFQIVHEHSAEHLIYNPHYLDIDRSDDIAIIQVTLSKGRSTAQKQAFYARLATLLQEKPGMRPQDIMIGLVENTREDWSFGFGEAQYLTLPREQWK